MKIFKQATAQQLLHGFEENRQEKGSCCCLIFHLSNLDINLKAQSKELIQNFITSEFHELSGSIFMMSISDIVFFIHNSNNNTIDKIRTDVIYCLSDILCESAPTNINQYVGQYDLKTHYADCYLKLKELAEKQDNSEKNNLDIKTKDGLKKDPQFFSLALKKNYNKAAFESLLGKRPTRSKKVILIVEDQVFSQNILKNCIGRDYIIETAEDAITGLKTYLRVAPDIVFLDWQLPDVSGIEFLKQIKKIDPNAYIIMSTANNTSDGVRNALSKGANGYITKPYNRHKISKNLLTFEQR